MTTTGLSDGAQVSGPTLRTGTASSQILADIVPRQHQAAAAFPKSNTGKLSREESDASDGARIRDLRPGRPCSPQVISIAGQTRQRLDRLQDLWLGGPGDVKATKHHRAGYRETAPGRASER